MKNILFYLFVFTVISNTGFAQVKLAWETDLEVAKIKAQQNKKPILAYFTGSDWCTPCKQLKIDFFHSEAFIEKSKGVVLLMIDLPFREDIISPEQRVKNKIVDKKYNPQSSYPKLVGLTNTGKVINSISSYSYVLRDTTAHFSFLNELLKH